jgi:hypothetical protein
MFQFERARLLSVEAGCLMLMTKWARLKAHPVII